MKTKTCILVILAALLIRVQAQDRGTKGVVPEFVLFVSPVTPTAVWSGSVSVTTTARIVPLELSLPFQSKVFSALYE